MMVNARPPLLLLAAALALGSTPCPGAEPPQPPSDPYQFRNVAIGGGGFVTGIIFSRAEKGLVYLRTDVGGAYRREAGSNEWVPLLDWAGQTDWNLYGVESLACDPQDARRVYIAAGTYTNPGTPNGEILRSTDRGDTWERTPLPFKLGGNESGRNNGERLAVDPNDGRVLFLGTRSSGLWRSGDSGATWARVAAFPDYDEALPVPTNPRWRAPQRVGINIVFFDGRSGARGAPTPVVYAAVSTPNASLFRSTDGGTTWAPIAGQPLGLRPTRAAFSATGVLYVSYGREAGPNTMTDGAVWKLDPSSGAWEEITPEKPGQGRAFGYGSVAVDPRRPETVLAGTWSHGNPFDEIFRSTDGGR
ncbi:MAG: xyloglucanase, partial [Opitutaceae bacterium]